MTATSETVVADQPEIALLDVLKGRVIAGQPIYVVGNPPGAVSEALDAAHQKIAEETGVPVRVVQVVELPALK